MANIFENLNFLEKKFQNMYNFDFTWLANHVPYGSALKLYSKMIFSSLRINSNRAEILKSIPFLSSIKYKNDSLCLYTLYKQIMLILDKKLYRYIHMYLPNFLPVPFGVHNISLNFFILSFWPRHRKLWIHSRKSDSSA